MRRLPAALALAALALSPTFFAASCSSGSQYAEMSGAEIYRRLCAQCHGPEGRAMTGLANSYVGKRDLWTEETLLRWLDDPRGYKPNVPHLKSSKRYMPPLSRSVPEEARKRLVAHVLGQMEALETQR
jgi:mono/diheme cytochrome c family protein